jgi:protein-S-isoprenylcysteine O-methyltransferase Ste14
MGLKLNVKEIGALLDASARQIDRNTVDRLLAARRVALERQGPTRPVTVLAHLRHFATGHAHGQHRPLNWVGAILLAAIAIGALWYWQLGYMHSHAELDLAILTDDLPLHMYVD